MSKWYVTWKKADSKTAPVSSSSFDLTESPQTDQNNLEPEGLLIRTGLTLFSFIFFSFLFSFFFSFLLLPFRERKPLSFCS